MTDDILDRRLTALLTEPPAQPDPVFAERIVALAAYDLALSRARRRFLSRVMAEAAALVAAVGSFAWLSSLPSDTAAGLGGTISLASPAMLGVALLALWALVAARDPAQV